MQFPGFPEATAINEYMFTAFKEVGINAKIEDWEYARWREQLRDTKKTHGTIHFRRTSFTTPMVVLRWYNARPPTGGGSSFWLTTEHQTNWDDAFAAPTKEEQGDLLRAIGDFKFDNYTEIPLAWLPGQAVVDPAVISDYTWPGNVDAGFDHFEYIKAAD